MGSTDIRRIENFDETINNFLKLIAKITLRLRRERHFIHHPTFKTFNELKKAYKKENVEKEFVEAKTSAYLNYQRMNTATFTRIGASVAPILVFGTAGMATQDPKLMLASAIGFAVSAIIAPIQMMFVRKEEIQMTNNWLNERFA
jgi:hypothetical protein